MTMKQQNATPKNQTRILIVEDQPIVCRGLIDLINREENLTVCGEAEDAHQAMERIAALNPDLVIVDITLKNSNGLDLVQAISKQYANLLCLVLSIHDEFLYAERALRAGAKGYIMKEKMTRTIVTAIHHVLDGEIYLSDPAKANLLHRFVDGPPDISKDPIVRLSNRELDVFRLIGQGYTTHEIAKQLRLSVKTIEHHYKHVKAKLKLKNLTQLIHYAARWVQNQE